MKGSVFKRKDGRWAGSVAVKDEYGKWTKKYVYADKDRNTKKEAQKKLNNLIYKLEHNLYTDNNHTSFESFLNEWLKIRSPKLAKTTIPLYKMYIKKHIGPEIGHVKLMNLKPNTLDKFYNKKLETLSPNTVIKFQKMIHVALNYAVKNELVPRNVSDYVDLPQKKEFQPQIYDEEKFCNLLNSVYGMFEEIPILLASVAGLRRGEIFGIRPIDLNFKKNTISIVETEVRWDNYVIKDPKSKRSKRVIRVPKFLMQVIKNYLDTLDVIPERVCSKYRPDSFSKRFKRLLEIHELPPTRLHDLRHYNAVIMLKYNIPDTVAAERLGHSQNVLKTTYQHALKDMHEEAADVIDNVFSSARNRKA